MEAERVAGAIEANDGVLHEASATDSAPQKGTRGRASLLNPHDFNSGEPVVPTQRASQFLAYMAIMANPATYSEVGSLLVFGQETAALLKLTQPSSDGTLESLRASADSLALAEARVWVLKLNVAIHEICFAWTCQK